jgi:hypothetical protein
MLLLFVVSGILLLSGAYLNQTVMKSNNGKMPVAIGDKIVHFDARHTLMTPQTKYKILGDIIWFPGHIVSFGDILMFSSVGLLYLVIGLTFLKICITIYKDSKNYESRT